MHWNFTVLYTLTVGRHFDLKKGFFSETIKTRRHASAIRLPKSSPKVVLREVSETFKSTDFAPVVLPRKQIVKH